MIYFAQAGNAVKIGFSRYVPARMMALKVGSHWELKLLAVMPGTLAHEKALHTRFRKDRIRGEWFALTSHLKSFIACLPSCEIGLCDVDAPTMEEIIFRENIAILCKAYCSATNISILSLSKKCYGNRLILRDFIAGRRSMTISKFQQVIDWFGLNWPEGVAWPDTRPVNMNREPHV